MNILILSRKKTTNTEKLKTILDNYGNVKIIEDVGDENPGFCNLCSTNFPTTTSWDRAFYQIDVEDTWFIEDDVAGTKETFEYLFAFTKNKSEELLSFYIESIIDDPDWWWWDKYPIIFNRPFKSFNPICRLSSNLISKILDFRNKNDGFLFHEILFSSLADTKFDLKNIVEINSELFKWRPEVTIEDNLPTTKFLAHPIKNSQLQNFIFDL